MTTTKPRYEYVRFRIGQRVHKVEAIDRARIMTVCGRETTGNDIFAYGGRLGHLEPAAHYRCSNCWR